MGQGNALLGVFSAVCSLHSFALLLLPSVICMYAGECVTNISLTKTRPKPFD